MTMKVKSFQGLKGTAVSRRSILEQSLTISLGTAVFGTLPNDPVEATQQAAQPPLGDTIRPTIRRVVTGNNRRGMSYIVSDERRSFSGLPSLFRTLPEKPMGEGGLRDPETILPSDFKAIAIPSGGSWCQFTVMPAARPDFKPSWHRSDTIDYHIQLSGELMLLLDEAETTLMPGDVLIQRNTNHAWRPKTSATFVVILLPLSKSR
jgi:hypothetical protein